jgi:predicted TIM-barrel fold metal-dependent hydrolase
MSARDEWCGVDRQFYAEHIRDFVPDRIIDVHTHVWLERFRAPNPTPPLRAVTWSSRVARENSIEDLLESYRLMFPEKQVTPLLFGNVMSREDDADGGNAYVSRNAGCHGFPALIFSLPTWDAAELERRIEAGGFIGAKGYLTLSDPGIPEDEIQIYDFFPPHQLEVLSRRGWILMLHIPRRGRLRDPVNLRQLLEIEERYPGLRLIVAHVGRAYCPEDVGSAFDVLKSSRRMMFDIAANSNQWVFEQLIRAVGPRRVLFGSDLPIVRMRTRRICEKGSYINLVPAGLYGDVSRDPHLREVSGPEADALTFFLYEEIAAFRRAADATGLSRLDVAAVFHDNAARLLAAAGRAP